jgi:hypothetical protein
MKKLILTIIFLSLSAFTVYYFGFRKGTTINRSEKQFALTEVKKIDRIVIVKGDSKIVLEKKSNSWSLNEKEVRNDLINLLFGVSVGLDAIAPVPIHSVDSVLEKLREGTKVSFYKKREIVNSFTLCKSNDNIFGLRGDYETPYKITLRGFSDIDLTKIYSTDENYWLTNIFINFEPEDIKSISIDYPANPDMGFILEKTDNSGYKISKKTHKKELSETDPEIISEYLYFFDNIRFYPIDDSTDIRNNVIISRNNFFNLSIQTTDGHSVSVSGYNKPEIDTSQIAPLNFYTVDTNNNVISLRFNDFDPILVHADYFLKK